MTGIDAAELAELAHLARLRVPEQDAEAMAGQVGRLLGFFARLKEVDTEGVEPSAYPLPIPHRMRPDRAETPLPRDEVLANAPRRRADCFQVPRIIEGG